MLAGTKERPSAGRSFKKSGINQYLNLNVPLSCGALLRTEKAPQLIFVCEWKNASDFSVHVANVIKN